MGGQLVEHLLFWQPAIYIILFVNLLLLLCIWQMKWNEHDDCRDSWAPLQLIADNRTDRYNISNLDQFKFIQSLTIERSSNVTSSCIHWTNYLVNVIILVNETSDKHSIPPLHWINSLNLMSSDIQLNDTWSPKQRSDYVLHQFVRITNRHPAP